MIYENPGDEIKLAKQRLVEAQRTLDITKEQLAVYNQALADWADRTLNIAATGGTSPSNWQALFSQHTWLVNMMSTTESLVDLAELNVRRAKEWIADATKRQANPQP